MNGNCLKWMNDMLNKQAAYQQTSCPIFSQHWGLVRPYKDFGARSRYRRHGKLIASHKILWDGITYPCLRYQLRAPKYHISWSASVKVSICHLLGSVWNSVRTYHKSQYEIKEKSTKSSRSSFKVVGLAPADLWEFPTLLLGTIVFF